MTGQGWLESSKGGGEFLSGHGEAVGRTLGKCRTGVDEILTGNSMRHWGELVAGWGWGGRSDEAGRASLGWNFGKMPEIGEVEVEVWYWQWSAAGRIPCCRERVQVHGR